jgi:hypothetical protein
LFLGNYFALWLFVSVIPKRRGIETKKSAAPNGQISIRSSDIFTLGSVGDSLAKPCP